MQPDVCDSQRGSHCTLQLIFNCILKAYGSLKRLPVPLMWHDDKWRWSERRTHLFKKNVFPVALMPLVLHLRRWFTNTSLFFEGIVIGIFKWTLLGVFSYMGHSTELDQSQVGNVLKFCMFFSKNVVHIYFVPYLNYTYLVKEPYIFISYFQTVLESSSSTKNGHYRNIVNTLVK